MGGVRKGKICPVSAREGGSRQVKLTKLLKLTSGRLSGGKKDGSKGGARRETKTPTMGSARGKKEEIKIHAHKSGPGGGKKTWAGRILTFWEEGFRDDSYS